MRLEQALELARRFHDGQFDKAGRPYLEHILRVVEGVETEDEKLAAAMHDLIEDTVLTSTDLRCAGSPYRIVEAVKALTKQEDEDYEDFIARAAQDPIARRVKLADLADNADEDRLALLEPELAARLRAKYAGALQLLRSLQPPSVAENVEAEGQPELSATFWCDEEGCGRPSGTLELGYTDGRGTFWSAGYLVVLMTFVGMSARPVPDERVASIRAALEAGDARLVHQVDRELAAFWCWRCERSYCDSHWHQRTLFDEGFFDCIDGTCPRGHVQTLDE